MLRKRTVLHFTLTTLSLAALSLPLSLTAQDDAPAAATEAAPAAETEAAPAAEAEAPKAGAPADPRSYALGVVLADNVVGAYEGLNVDYKELIKGFSDKIEGKQVAMDDAAIQAELDKATKEAEDKMREEAENAPKINKEKGEKFLAENKDKEGVKTTKSGLQYKVEKPGEGASPTAEDTVTAHYKGTLLNGETFDSSYDRGQPLEMPVGGVIKGWQEMLQLMKVGEKVTVWIPSDLAYGEYGQGPIGPNETLVFEMELLGIKGK